MKDHGANFDLILGNWGEGATPADHFVVALVCRIGKNGPEFMVVDAGDRPAASGELAAKALSRDEVIGKPLASDVFGLVDAILEQDDRISEITGR